jgi:hypothetical protein
MNFTEDNATNIGQASQRASHNRARTTLLRWTSLAGLLSVIAVMGAVATTAAPANAMVRFCTATVCIGQPNGCNVRASTGVVVMVDDGDSFIASDGSKWTCTHGKWVITSKIVSTGGGITANVGNLQEQQLASGGGTTGPTVTAVTAAHAEARLAR